MSQRLAIIGYGKMGKLIERLAPEYGFEVRAKFSGRDNPHAQALSHETLRGIDVAVEFTTPEAAPQNIRRLAVLGVNTVVGTTGWLEQLPALRTAIADGKTGLVWAANFSVGVNLFLQTVARAAALFAKHPEYEAWAWEIHHSAKKDAPSGTLKKLAEEIRDAGYARLSTSVRAAPARFQARTKSASIPWTIPSRFGIRLAAAGVSRVARCKRRAGLPAKKAFSSSRRF